MTGRHMTETLLLISKVEVQKSKPEWNIQETMTRQRLNRKNTERVRVNTKTKNSYLFSKMHAHCILLTNNHIIRQFMPHKLASLLACYSCPSQWAELVIKLAITKSTHLEGRYDWSILLSFEISLSLNYCSEPKNVSPH